jgi:hypothetical protein
MRMRGADATDARRCDSEQNEAILRVAVTAKLLGERPTAISASTASTTPNDPSVDAGRRGSGKHRS